MIGSQRMFAAKLCGVLLICCLHTADSYGQTVHWIRQFGTSGSDQAHGVAAGNSTIYVVGTTTGTFPGLSSTGQDDAFLRRYDSAGNLIWERQFGTSAVDSGDGVAVSGSGVYAVGSTNGTFPGEVIAGGQDGYVRKYDVNGVAQWTRQFGGTKSDSAFGVSADATGVYVVGSTDLNGGVTQATLHKYDSNGTLLWSRSFGAGTTTTLKAVAADGAGVFVGGSSSGLLPGQADAGAFVRRYDSDGNEQWTRQFGSVNNAIVNAVAAVSDAVYIAGGAVGALPGQPPSGFSGGFVRKYDIGGNEQWTRQFGASNADEALALAADPTGAYVAGHTDGELIGGTSAGGRDAYIRKYDGSGNIRWTRQIGSPSSDSGEGVSGDGSGLYAVGQTSGTLPDQSSAGGNDDGFLAQLDLGGPPYVPFNGIVNGASYSRAVVAGSIASAFGLSLKPQDPTSLVVQAGSTQAPVFADTPSQINFQVPWELAGQAQAFLTVSGDGNSSAPVSIPLASYAPAIFSADASGTGQGAILIANTPFLAAPEGMFPGSRPIQRGEFISIFATGLGPVTNQPATGVPASSDPPSLTLISPTVTIGGIAVPASFSGLAPAFFGLYQVNVQVPQGVAASNAVQVSLSMAGTVSNIVTIAVQ